MKVVILFEHSGIVREAFKNYGHDAISIDILPSEIPGNHIQSILPGNFDNAFWEQFDLAICHPPCTYLSYAAKHVWNEPGRSINREAALDLFIWCLNLPIDKICVENPMGYVQEFIKCDQIIHPYYFGDNDLKRTCLWLKNLPKLEYSNFKKKFCKPAPYYIDSNGKNRYFTDCATGERWKVRSKTFKSIANAMASQWSNIQYEQLKLII